VKIRRIDFSPDEWIAGTVGLSNAERGLYITACALIYSHGGPIPEVELRRSCRDHGHSFKSQLSRLISLGKLLSKDGQIDNKRCSNELQKAFKRFSKTGQNFSKEVQNEPECNENNDLHEPRARARGRHHQPSTINHQPVEDPDASASGVVAPARATDPKDPLSGRKKPNGRKTRIAADWCPDLTDCQYAAGRGWDAGRIGEEADAFADHCRRDEKGFADWNAAWRTWVRNSDKFAARNGHLNGGGRHAAARSGSLVEAVRNVAARFNVGGE
jgi:uncharacterized protein YdaU (DUF1376 family)